MLQIRAEMIQMNIREDQRNPRHPRSIAFMIC
jgi:hypothetical protein